MDILQDDNIDSKNTEKWEINWWDLMASCEKDSRGIAWTQSNTLLTSHYSQTLIQSQILFEKQTSTFLPMNLQKTPPVGTHATVIAVSPRDELVFAFYPTRPNDMEYGMNAGIGYMYERKKGDAINEWQLHPPLAFPVGDGVVAAKWLMEDRRWVGTDPPTRMPFQGPHLPHDRHSLILVTESHNVRLICQPLVTISIGSTQKTNRVTSPSRFYYLTASLLSVTMAQRQGPVAVATRPTDHATRVVTKAAIGVSYDESHIFIAYLSKLVPSTTELGAEAQAGAQPKLGRLDAGWEDFTQPPVIECSLIHISNDGLSTRLASYPLPATHLPTGNICTSTSLRCNNLQVIPIPSPKEDRSNNPSRSSNSSSSNFSGRINPAYIVASYIDFGDYTSPPISTIHTFRIQKEPPEPLPIPKAVLPPFEVVHLTSKALEGSVPIHLDSFIGFKDDNPLLPHLSSPQPLLVCAELQLTGVVPTKSARASVKNEGRVEAGKIRIMNPETLSESNSYEPSSLTLPVEELKKPPLPISMAISPNEALLAINPSNTDSLASKTYLLPFPSRSSSRFQSQMTEFTQGQNTSKPTLNPASIIKPLIVSLLSFYRSPSDILHRYRITQLNFSAADLIIPTIHQLQEYGHQPSEWQLHLLCLGSELSDPRSSKDRKSRTSVSNKGSSILLARDIASIMAIIDAFKIARHDRGKEYDREMIISLVGLSAWITKYIARMMRQLVLYQTSAERALFQATENREALLMNGNIEVNCTESNKHALASVQEVPSALLPLVLQNLRAQLMSTLKHILSLKGYVESQSSSNEKAQLASELLSDTLDTGIVTWRAFYNELENLKTDEDCAIPEEEAVQALYSLQIPKSVYPKLFNVAKRLIKPSICSRSRLLGVGQPGGLDEMELYDISELSIHPNSVDHRDFDPFKKPREDLRHDVITKTPLPSRYAPEVAAKVPLRMCTRCHGLVEKRQLFSEMGMVGGRSAAMINSDRRWRAWLKRWEKRCVCGGFWVMHPVAGR